MIPRISSTFSRSGRRLLSYQVGSAMAERCDKHLVHSPYPPVCTSALPPFFEFISSKWNTRDSGCFDKLAIVDGSTGLSRTYKDYFETSTRVAAGLASMGVTAHSCVAMYCPNHVDYLPVAMAVSMLGAKLTPVNPLCTSQELELVLHRSKSSVLICHTSTLPVGTETARNCTHLKHIIAINDNAQVLPEGVIDFLALQGHREVVSETIPAVHGKTFTHPLLLPYSSGTTGLPKGVVLTHRNIVANVLQLYGVEGASDASTTAFISPLPFFHIYAFTVSLAYSAWKDTTLITMSSRFDLEQFCRLVEHYQPQKAHAVPPILLGLAQSPVVNRYDLSSLDTLMSGAAPLGKEIEAIVTKRIGCRVKQGWGMSELSPLGALNPDSCIKSGSIGPLLPSTTAKIVDEHGNSLPPHHTGELLIRGPQVMLGYMDEPDKTDECLSASGWLRTGDLAHYDEDGYFFIRDRLKELIKVRGFQVPPAELEALLLTHPSVLDCAVISIECEFSGELPRAYVVLKTPHDTEPTTIVSEQSIYHWVKERVAPHKRLDGGVEFIDAIPKSPSGKILRRVLRDQLNHSPPTIDLLNA